MIHRLSLVTTINQYFVAITLGFEQTSYTVEEDTGIFQPGPVTIIKELSRVSEQILSVNLDFISLSAVISKFG